MMGDQASNPASKPTTADFATESSHIATTHTRARQGEGGVADGEAGHAQPIGQGPTKFSAKGFLYSEARLAVALNVNRDELRWFRELYFVKGADFEKKHGDGEILLNAEAIWRFALHTGANFSALNLGDCLPVEKKTIEPHTMTITKKPINPRMVLAVFDDDPIEHLVEVGRSATLAIGDRIEVSEHETQKGGYQLTSPLPRDLRRPR
jgi:hypothetical protein